MKKKVVIFISGNGSNMLSLIKESKAAGYPAEIVAVICDRPHAAGIEKARKYDLPVHVFDRTKYPSRDTHEESILDILAQYKPDFICLAGYMRLISSRFIKLYEGRILNIHPSLLPAFKGLHVHERVIEEGVKITGCTVHLVVEEMDAGKILAQAAVPVYHSDTAEILAQRVLKVEHELYPKALKFLIQNYIEEDVNTQQKLLSF
ncbi:phosphoribosylglycinamide formyltransferase [Bartonella ancashensis]|uniref:phosphoribosylglycinamide formyltransferase n=1 Tax=Bartonella ancashensis TaxID=1318743 RepID=UPI0039E6387B